MKKRLSLVLNGRNLRLLKGDEAGITMALTVITIALLGVLGAGLLVFATTDLNTVVESNRGQKAFEMADAGVGMAKKQLEGDSDAASYDGGEDDRQWSSTKANTNCPALGNSGICFSGLDGASSQGAANVKIQSLSGGRFLVVSTGSYGPAKRRVEATFRSGEGVSFPQVYFSRGNLTVTGSATFDRVSLFTLGDASINKMPTGTMDRYFGRWATTSGLGPYPNSGGSFPNSYNQTARSTSEPAVAARGTVTGLSSDRGSRIFDGSTNPRVVPNYAASSLANSQKISFPFKVATEAEDELEIDILRQRALTLERDIGGNYYMDSIPGNGVDDPGRPNGNNSITSWPSASAYDTVIFYEYATYNSGNDVGYSPPSSQAPCGLVGEPAPTNAAKGIIVVQNGDMAWSGNRGFYGGVITRPYDATGNLIPSAPKNFDVNGATCLRGYANSGGEMYLSGNVSSGDVPILSSFSSLSSGPEIEAWRELYQ